MRVLIVSQYFWPEDFRVNAITASLVERGIHVEVLTGKPNYPRGTVFSGYRILGCQEECWKGAVLHRVPLWPRGRGGSLGLVVNYLSFIFFGLICGSWLVRKRQYDVIFFYGLSPILSAIPALFIGWMKKRKVIIWVQDIWPESLTATGHVHNPVVIGVVRKVVSFIYRRASLLLVQSHAFKEPVQVLASDTPIAYYPNSVDDTFSLPVLNEIAFVPGLHQKFSVLFAGNIGVAQAVDVILEAATLLKEYADIHFVVMGEGSCRGALLKSVQERNLTNLSLPGRFPVESMPGFMQTASVLLVTLADQKIFSATVPSKVQAYLAAGRPIIACLNGEGARIVVEAKAGLATPAEDAEALADAVLRLYRLPLNEMTAMGENGRRYYQEHFNHEQLVQQLIGYLYAESIQK